MLFVHAYSVQFIPLTVSDIQGQSIRSLQSAAIRQDSTCREPLKSYTVADASCQITWEWEYTRLTSIIVMQSFLWCSFFSIFMIHVVCSCCWPNPTSKAGKFLIACTDGHACVVVCSSITIKLCSRLCSHAIRFSWQQPAPVNCSTSTSMLSMSIWHLFSGTFLYGR